VDPRALAILGWLLLELQDLAMCQQSAIKHGLLPCGAFRTLQRQALRLMQIAVRGDDRALAIRGQLLLELHYLEIRRQSAVKHDLHDVERGCIKRAYLIRKLLDGPDGPLNDQVVSPSVFLAQ
jgi:hypothetical protein